MDTKEYNGRTYHLVPSDHPHMRAAAQARDACSGDRLFPIGAVLVKDGEVVARAGNGYNGKRNDRHVCPRIVEQCPSGVGYELCDYCQPAGHAEPMLLEAARENGIDPNGADVYMFGHWWCCEPCWKAMEEAGIRHVYLPHDAKQLFENVRDDTTQLSIETVYIAGTLTSLSGKEREMRYLLYEMLGDVCEEIGCEGYVPHLHTGPESNPDALDSEIYRIGAHEVQSRDVTVAEVSSPSHGVGGELVLAHVAGKPIVLLSETGIKVSRFVTGNPSVVYHLEYETSTEVVEKLPRILKQL